MAFTVFLDRDGVINQDSSDYIKTSDEFVFIPQSPEAISLLNRNGACAIVITNQSLIGRKMAAPETLETIFDKMKTGVEEAGGKIKDIFFCPHLPGEGCRCRKPEPGLILEAREKYGLDLRQSVMVGDSAKDIQCGQNAGCAYTVLVMTGNGPKARLELASKGMAPDYTATDLYDAALWIIGKMAR